MSDVTQLLKAIESGEGEASERLLPLVYEELRKLAAQRLAGEAAGQTLQPTALVHEAYLRLVDQSSPPAWESRGHFFAAAAEAMRRILIESARRKASLKRGGDREKTLLDADDIAAPHRRDDLLALNDALEQLEVHDADAAKLVKLRYFAGLTMEQTANALGLSERNAYRIWNYAKAWLLRALDS
jgi:RNA polymerase sigma factor (TIGR02999 family)